MEGFARGVRGVGGCVVVLVVMARVAMSVVRIRIRRLAAQIGSVSGAVVTGWLVIVTVLAMLAMLTCFVESAIRSRRLAMLSMLTRTITIVAVSTMPPRTMRRPARVRHRDSNSRRTRATAPRAVLGRDVEAWGRVVWVAC